MSANLTEREADMILESHTAEQLLDNVKQIIVERYFNPEGIEYDEE